jgi:ferric-dicitrate binding protein FerR (iron transport regulator)
MVSRPIVNPQIATLHPTPKQVILPGTNVATLTLGNGKQILLNSANKGTLAVQGNTVITKNAAGQISYKVTGTGHTNEKIAYNTVTTPLGGQYRITLPDGSNVWLNAGSSLKYPSRFVGNERHVELHGEAYFEIFKNKNAPFTVAAENVNIKVLGTHFNVMAYENEPAVNTTLLEGSVALNSKSAHAMLIPGQQAVADKTADNIILRKVNVEDAVAWKNGYFSFRKENIKTAMNKIARWYNVDVEYSGNVNNKILGGTVSRAENINELLNYVELTGIAKFKIEGRRIKVICK